MFGFLAMRWLTFSSMQPVLSAATNQFRCYKRQSADILDASVAIRSKMSLTNELRMAIALFEIPVSGCTCLRTGHKTA